MADHANAGTEAAGDLAGTTALVTGGSKGIGLGVAEALAGAGANVAVTARDERGVEAAAERLKGLGGGGALGLRCDVRDYGQQAAVVERVVNEFGGLDLLVANAGVGRFGPVDELSLEDWHAVIDTNLTGVFYSVKAAAAALKASRGLLITISSLAGANFFAGGSAYNASKFGLTGFTQAVMLDLRPHGVRVSTIMPGSVATAFGSGGGADAEWKIQPEDLGATVLYLARLPARTLPSKIEVRPSRPPGS